MGMDFSYQKGDHEMENKKTAQNPEQSKAKAPAELENEALDQVAGGMPFVDVPIPPTDPLELP